MPINNIHIYFSHEVEQLANQLIDHVLMETRQRSNPLRPSCVIVPNANMQRYLQLVMAESTGITANMEFPFLEKGLSQYLNLFEQDSNPTVWTQADIAINLNMLLADDQVLDTPVMTPIKRYLSSQNSAQLLSKKRWQLAHRLALLFISYELQRPEMVVHWLQGRNLFSGSQDQHLKELEQAESYLYQQLINVNQPNKGHSLFQRFQLVDWAKQRSTEVAMHLFTPTRLSAFHRHYLSHLAQYMPIHIYQLNVCCEYWEDMTTEGEDSWMKNILSKPTLTRDAQGSQLNDADGENPELFVELDDAHAENPLLKAWAKPGRESLRLFSQMEDDAIHLNVHYSPDWLMGDSERNNGALHVIQDAILYRQPADQVLCEQQQLKTLQLAEAPSIHREVQAVYNNVLSNLKNDPSLKLTDMAILVADMDKYRSVIEQVFAEQDKQHPHHLPYSLIDSTVKQQSLFAQAVLGLFDVLEQNFMRSAVMKWLANDCVMQALKLDNDTLAEWLDWASRLGIYSGFDHLYDSTEDKPYSKRFTWQQGLHRLRLSLVSGAVSSPSEDASLMGKLAWVIEGLYRWHMLLQKPMKAVEWQQQLTQLFATFIAVPADHSKEEQVRIALNASLEKLVHHAGEQTMSLADIRYFIDEEFTHLSASKGNYLSGGIICAALQPMRPIPFKITFVLGLDERSFPGEVYQETLDLTQRNRRMGDINKIENMNYLFLETLMCTRERLYLSYVGQDLVKDERILPSSTWQQLRDYATSLMNAAELGIETYPVTAVPLDSADLIAIEPTEIGADWLINYAPNDHHRARINHHRQPGDQLNMQHVTNANMKASQDSGEHSIQVQAVVKFLENPVLSYLDQLGASSQLLNDKLNTEHEPFELDGLSRHQLFDAAAAEYLLALDQGKDLSLMDAIDQHYSAMAAESQLPIPLFADLDKLCELEHHHTFTSLQKELKSLNRMPGPVVFGDGMNQTTPTQRLSALLVKAKDNLYQINGCWEGLYTTDGVISHQVVVSSSSAVGRWSKHLIKPFIYWCMAQLDDEVVVAENFQLRIMFRDKVHSCVFKPWSSGVVSFSTKSTIMAYLIELLAGFNNAGQVNLPFESLSSLKVDVEGKEFAIPYLSSKSKAKTLHVFAIDQASLSPFEAVRIQRAYEELAGVWLENHSYHELLKALNLHFDHDAMNTYRKRLLPLHVMVEAKLP